jgi:fumarylpyruvate hydrolase
MARPWQFPLFPVSCAAIEGGGGFPVRRIYWVGRKYAANARETGQGDRKRPFFFTKFPDMLAPGGSAIVYPPATAD